MCCKPQQSLEMTGCMPPCTKSKFDISLSRPSMVPVWGNTTANMILHFYIPEPIYTVTEEFLVYDFPSFMADLAGMFGILLGVSFLAVYDQFCDTFLNNKIK